MDKLYASARIGDIPHSDEYEPKEKEDLDQVLIVVVGLLETIIKDTSIDKNVRIDAAVAQFHFYENTDVYNKHEEKIMLYPNIKSLLQLGLMIHDSEGDNTIPLWWDELPHVRKLVTA
jgi:uncharacterized protein (UPF0147 family)